jgi:hypothetical protein
MNWFNKQPVGVKAAIITVCGMIAVATISALSSWMNTRSPKEDIEKEHQQLREQLVNETPSNIQKNFKPYDDSKFQTALTANVSLVAFTLDTRHNDLKVEETKQENYSMHVRGNSYPVFICAFHNGTDKPAIFTGAEIVDHGISSVAEVSGVRIEPFEAVHIYIEPGFQPFVPPLMLPSSEVGAIHVMLTESQKIEGIDFGLYNLIFRVNDKEIETPIFLWTQK